jgi:hypothetical protein
MPDPHTRIEVPVNIQEFNKIAGFVFAQLYASFPVVTDIDRAANRNCFWFGRE